MSLFVHALALFPAVAVAIVGIAALADRRETTALNELRNLDDASSKRAALAAQRCAA